MVIEIMQSGVYNPITKEHYITKRVFSNIAIKQYLFGIIKFILRRIYEFSNK